MEENALSDKEWDSLSDYQKNRILEGLEQAEAGLGTPVAEITKMIREKYGLSNKKSGDEIDAEEQAEIEEGLRQADRGNVLSHKEVMARYDSWRAKPFTQQ